MVVIREERPRLWKRVRREIARVGLLRFLDVLAFRVYNRVAIAGKDRVWERETLRRLEAAYPRADGVDEDFGYSESE